MAEDKVRVSATVNYTVTVTAEFPADVDDHEVKRSIQDIARLSVRDFRVKPEINITKVTELKYVEKDIDKTKFL